MIGSERLWPTVQSGQRVADKDVGVGLPRPEVDQLDSGGMGFGKKSRIHKAGLLDLSTDLPIVIEIVDADEKIEGFMPEVDRMVKEGLVTLEKVRVIKYSAGDGAQ